MAKKTDLIAYCGLYCATCPAHTQVVANLAKDLMAQLKKDKFDKVADYLAKMPMFKAFKHYEKGNELLETMTKMRCGKVCKAGGGWEGCKVRKCAKKKELAGCWLCDEFKTCGTLKILEKSGDTTHLKNIRKIRKLGAEGFVKESR